MRPRLMTVRLSAILGLACCSLWAQSAAGDFATLLSAPGRLEIVRHPGPADYRWIGGGPKLRSLPHYDPGSQDLWQMDIRSKDLGALDLAGRLSDLLQVTFDSKTVWPKSLPAGFDAARIMALGANPGLGLRSLHRQGITGRGVGIAIIDQALLVDHVEYKDQLRLYEEIRWHRGSEAQMHGPAVASIAVGKTVGVAPGADLYFVAEWHARAEAGGQWDFDLTPLAAAIDRIVEIDGTLPRNRRIRVISVSLGINPAMGGYDQARESMDRARRAGIATVYVGSEPYRGLGREPLADPDRAESYTPGQFWASQWRQAGGMILIPMDSRCVAAPNGSEDYVFYRAGGMSWAAPWVAGLFALACQVRPDITWDRFWAAVGATSDEAKAVLDGAEQTFGKIVNPVRLLATLQER